jgi:hypothetical protein
MFTTFSGNKTAVCVIVSARICFEDAAGMVIWPGGVCARPVQWHTGCSHSYGTNAVATIKAFFFSLVHFVLIW